MNHSFLLLPLILFSCKNDPQNPSDSASSQPVLKDTIFEQVISFPQINDSSDFIFQLRETFDIETGTAPYDNGKSEITCFEKVRIYGAEDEFFLIELDYKKGAGAGFPWKVQLILDKEGRLIEELDALHYELVEIFPDENPFLLAVHATDKGNGGHSLYKMTNRKLENVYDDCCDYRLRTYDAHRDENLNDPVEMKFDIRDYNKDGFNDISFKGKVITFDYDETRKAKSVELVYIYDSNSGHFKAKEDYLVKYNLEE